MQISRILPLACAAAVLASLVAARADDNEAQLRARQALEQKMKELPPATEEVPAQAPKKKKSKKEAAVKPAPAHLTTNTPPVVQAEPKPVEPTPAPAAPVTPAPTSAPEVQATVPAQPATPAVPTTPESAPTVQTPPPAEFSSPAKPAQPDATEKAREAMRQKMAEMPPQPEAAPTNAGAATPKPPIEEYHPAKPTVQKPAMGLAPIEAPASSLPASKEQRLQQLLQLYRADQITPQEYHDQRAKILSEP